MRTDRLDAVLERLEDLLDKTEEEERRHELREIQQLVIGVRSDLASDDGDGD